MILYYVRLLEKLGVSDVLVRSFHENITAQISLLDGE